MFKRNTFILIVSVVIIVLGMFAFYIAKKVESLPKFDETYIQSQIDNFIEKKGEGKKYGVEYELKSTVITITSDVHIRFFIKLHKAGFTENVIASVKGIPVYNKDEKKFYFSAEKVDIEELNTEGKFKPKGIIGRVVEKTGFVDKVMADNELIKDTLTEAVTFYLRVMPIYKLPKEKLSGKIVGMALQKVEISNGEIIAVISYWELTKSVIMFLFGIFVAIIIAIAAITKPEILGALIIMDIIS